jgi:hypothetical protein
MTIADVLRIVKEEKPNTFTDAKLIEYINEVEAFVAKELRMPQSEWPTYTTSDMTDELIAEYPYDRLYVSYLKTKIDYALGEYASYQLNSEQFDTDFSLYCDFVVREAKADTAFTPTRFRNIF